MPKLRRPIAIVLALAIFLGLSSCLDDFDKLKDPDWNPELAIPLVDSRFSVERVFQKALEEGSLVEGVNGTIHLVYSGQLFEIKAEEFISFQDFIVDLSIVQGELPFPSPSALIKHIDFDDGFIVVHIEDDLTEDALVTLNMPKATKNGQAFSETFKMKYSGNAVTVFDTIFLLADYNFDLTGSNGNSSNQVNINYEAETVSSGQPVQLDVFRVEFRDLSYAFVDGYLGKVNIGSFDDSLQLSLFDNFKSGSIILEDPRINFEIVNGFGIPIKLSFTTFSGSGPGGNTQLGGSAIDNGFNVGSPSDTTKPLITTEEINNGNSNIGNFLSITPRRINYEVALVANENDDTTSYNFLSKTSSLRGEIDLDIPLMGRLDSVVFEDRYDLDLSSTSNVDLAIFKIWTENFFPVGVYVQVYFEDAAENVLDSLVVSNTAIFREAITDIDGFSKEASIEENYFALGEERYAKVRDLAKYMRISSMLLTDQSDFKSVKFRDDNYFELKMGVITSVHDSK